jgi:hypothetical protein
MPFTVDCIGNYIEFFENDLPPQRRFASRTSTGMCSITFVESSVPETYEGTFAALLRDRERPTTIPSPTVVFAFLVANRDRAHARIGHTHPLVLDSATVARGATVVVAELSTRARPSCAANRYRMKRTSRAPSARAAPPLAPVEPPSARAAPPLESAA